MLGKYWATLRQRLSASGQTNQTRSTSQDDITQSKHQVEQKNASPSTRGSSAGANIHGVHSQIDCSPLFRMLPPEVRTIVWTYVIDSDSTIHIARLGSGLAGMRCCGEDLEDRMHSCCWGKHELTAPGVYHYERTTDIQGRSHRQSGMASVVALLMTCQQAYIEARPILYSANHFHFNSIKVFQEFSRTLAPQTLHTIRSLSFTCAIWHTIYPEDMDTRPPTSIFPFDSAMWEETWRIVASMQDLQNLLVVLHMLRHPHDTSSEWDERLLSPIRQVRPQVRLSVVLEWGSKENIEEKGGKEVHVDNMTVRRRPNWSFEEGVAFTSSAPQWRIYKVPPMPNTEEELRSWVVRPSGS